MTGTAINIIFTRATEYTVVSAFTPDCIVTGATVNPIVARTTIDCIFAFTANDQIVAAIKADIAASGVRDSITFNMDLTTITEDKIVPPKPIDLVVTGTTENDISAVTTDNCIITGCARNYRPFGIPSGALFPFFFGRYIPIIAIDDIHTTISTNNGIITGTTNDNYGIAIQIKLGKVDYIVTLATINFKIKASNPGQLDVVITGIAINLMPFSLIRLYTLLASIPKDFSSIRFIILLQCSYVRFITVFKRSVHIVSRYSVASIRTYVRNDIAIVILRSHHRRKFMFIIETEQGYVARNIPLFRGKPQIHIRIEFGCNRSVHIEYAEQAQFANDLLHFAEANLAILVGVKQIETNVDAHTATDTGTHASIEFGGGCQAAIERKFVDIDSIFVFVHHIEAIEQAAIVLTATANPLADTQRVVTKAELDGGVERHAQARTERTPDAHERIPVKIKAERGHRVFDKGNIFAKQHLEYLRRIVPDKIPAAVVFELEALIFEFFLGIGSNVRIFQTLSILFYTIVYCRSRGLSLKEIFGICIITNFLYQLKITQTNFKSSAIGSRNRLRNRNQVLDGINHTVIKLALAVFFGKVERGYLDSQVIEHWEWGHQEVDKRLKRFYDRLNLGNDWPEHAPDKGTHIEFKIFES